MKIIETFIYTFSIFFFQKKKYFQSFHSNFKYRSHSNTYSDYVGINDIDDTTDNNNKITTIRWITEVILQRKQNSIFQSCCFFSFCFTRQ